MSLTVPLSVRIRTSQQDRHITDELSDLSFGATVPGGYTDCQMSLHRPITFTPGEIEHFGRVYVYDAETANTVWEGELQDPGRTVADEGETYQLTAVGGSSHLQDINAPVAYVVNDFADFYRAANNAPGGTNTVGEDPSGNDNALVLQFPGGQSISNTSRVSMRYAYMQVNGQDIGRVDYDWDGGVDASTYHVQAVLSTGGGASDIPNDQSLTAAGFTGASTVVGDFTFGRDTLDLRFEHVSGGIVTIPDDVHWVSFFNVFMQSIRFGLDGNAITTASEYVFRRVRGYQIVKDVLGRWMTGVYDTTNAVIATTNFEIDKMAYNDGTTPAGILEDLMQFDPYYYAVWGSNPDNNKFTFEWTLYPTTVTLEADVMDGFDSPSSGNTIYDQVWVRWVDSLNRTRNTFRTAVAPDLVAAGFHRTFYLDQGSEVGSADNAVQAGDQFLADHLSATNAGRLVVRKSILDTQTGLMVAPWAIRPGRLIRVKGVQAYPDALNNTGRDSVTVFRVVSTRFDAGAGAATLELDSYTTSVSKQLAKLTQVQTTAHRHRSH